MAKNTSVTLGPHYEEFIAQMVASGRYATSSEVIRAGLRMIEDYEQRLEVLRREIQKGEESGLAEDFDFNKFIEKMKRGNDIPA
ncbi:type II toxin-antitoxin system ParD family antitoxin [Corynebacterium genitalium ATCC 33030]|uniref:Addiction module antidote protein, CC2985 family n=1 Tax=Corynebacterium genitalium ATCC 33030 TaxID=585529 RepID=D7WF89_9CORY|nr:MULTISPECIES: type II toxin-antitoxin system ParD family antitoxin [Corynebacterium]MCQ4618490.1 type II toxin-antitoxin system ParD family antitoxin [Corynebacterium pseudogenitalium]EFK54523.1 addiction module antidote protein, CC2985 family [Corynebacterium genitalium ATCC 33030]MCQ4623656.1 type II toxin-antitoxin system ParD family antitoxin [Corynebacterium sp. CCUG 70398]MCQ4625756.1 type II toxin-antitoxin system ParD family antitoxin [Corynebacterium sp. CCUG 69979]MCQ4627352.1 typ